MSDGSNGDSETPAEQRLLVYLDGLREHPPQPRANLVAAVMRTARWQAAARPYLAAIGSLGGAVGAGVSVLVGARGRG
jgi:hypothetical protein